MISERIFGFIVFVSLTLILTFSGCTRPVSSPPDPPETFEMNFALPPGKYKATIETEENTEWIGEDKTDSNTAFRTEYLDLDVGTFESSKLVPKDKKVQTVFVELKRFTTKDPFSGQFDSDSEEVPKTPLETFGKQTNKMVGSKWKFAFFEDGKLFSSSVQNEVSSLSGEPALRMIIGAQSKLPEKPVSLEESWTSQKNLYDRLSTPGPRFNCTLKEITEENGQKIARIICCAQESKNEYTSRSNNTIEYNTEFDFKINLDTGLIYYVEETVKKETERKFPDEKSTKLNLTIVKKLSLECVEE